ncbi:hypothetical protein TRVL_06201 [Trypanosoma vivax]|nr:hypothetical protein TRVL_06201 [Trypanosoma vivax]
MAQRVSSDWGEMVLPGVFMRKRVAPIAGKLINASLEDKVEFVLSRIEETEAHIKKLRESNAFIRDYISENRFVKNDDPCFDHDALVCSLGNDYNVLMEALAENEALISIKEKDVKDLKRLLQANHCSCANRLHNAPVPSGTVLGNAENNETSNEEEGAEEHSSGPFCL